MGDNFYTPYQNTAPKTNFTVTAMDAPFAELDKAITYLKNVIVSGGGFFSHVKSTGVLSWSGTIRIRFYTAAGSLVENTVAAGNITLADGEAAYVTLNETDATALTVSKAASGFLAYNVLVLAYRETTSDNIFSVHLHPQLNDPDKIVQALVCADSVTVDWSAGSTATITLDRATTTFAFSGARNGQRCVLIVKQYAGPGAVAFGAEARGGTDLTVPPTLTETENKKDYLGFIYNGADSKYDFVSISQGY